MGSKREQAGIHSDAKYAIVVTIQVWEGDTRKAVTFHMEEDDDPLMVILKERTIVREVSGAMNRVGDMLSHEVADAIRSAKK